MNHRAVADRFVARHARGRASGCNLRYEGDRLYSYSTCVARWMDNRLLIATKNYSSSTSTHLGHVRQAAYAANITPVFLHTISYPEDNFAHYRNVIREAAARLLTRRFPHTRLYDRSVIVQALQDARHNADVFGVAVPDDLARSVHETLTHHKVPEATIIKLAKDRLLQEAA